MHRTLTEAVSLASGVHKRQRYTTQLFLGSEEGKGRGENIDLKFYLWAPNSNGWPSLRSAYLGHTGKVLISLSRLPFLPCAYFQH